MVVGADQDVFFVHDRSFGLVKQPHHSSGLWWGCYWSGARLGFCQLCFECLTDEGGSVHSKTFGGFVDLVDELLVELRPNESLSHHIKSSALMEAGFGGWYWATYFLAGLSPTLVGGSSS